MTDIRITDIKESMITEDGSQTFRHPLLGEPYHTKAGAIVEALEKHARALKVWEKQNPVIFDVCSGLSYSAACALEEIRNHGNNSQVTIYLFENDLAILEKMLKLPDIITYTQDGLQKQVTCYHIFKDAVRQFIEHRNNVYESKGVCIIILFGDFMSTIEEIGERADFIFYAPFSPLFTPDMWTLDVFSQLYSHTASSGKLSTYSYARKVRDALSKAGFKIENGPTLGRRSPSLIAIKK